MIEDPRAEYHPPAAPPELAALEAPETADALRANELLSSLDLSPEAWRPPLSLRIVAFVFKLFGVLSAVEILIHMAVLQRVNINFGVLTLFISSGLRKWRSSSRSWALFWSWLALVFLVIWLPLALYAALIGKLPASVTVDGATAQGMTFCVCVIGYLIWQIRVLHRSDIRQRFETAKLWRLAPALKRHAQHRGWQFSLGSLLMAMVVLTFVMVRLTADDVRYKLTDTGARTAGASFHYGVQQSRFGIERDRLAYVVFVNDGSRSPIVHTFGVGGRRVLLTLPGQDEIELPGRHQLYEIDNNQLRTREERVTLAEFKSFLETGVEINWTFDALVKYAEEMRAKQAEAK